MRQLRHPGSRIRRQLRLGTEAAEAGIACRLADARAGIQQRLRHDS